MVYFTCNNCGESVKKPAVEKHYNGRCHNNPKNVSCMDCLKDFHGEEYVAHTSCISEAEKYSGKNYIRKENKNSGQKKQESWMEIVRSILESKEYKLSEETRDIFKRLQNYENVPRKKAKFENFVGNCLKMHVKKAKPVWEILEKELANMKKIKQLEIAAAKLAIQESKEDNPANTEQKRGVKRKQDDTHNEMKIKKKKSKNQNEEIAEGNSKTHIPAESEGFQWSAVLEKAVAKHPEGLSLEKLNKKMLKKYKRKLSLEELNESQLLKFEKKLAKTLKKSPTIQVNGVFKIC